MRYLLSISIGPVQDFIAAARKTRDLWFGSEVLCRMSRAAAKSLRDEVGASLVFPPETFVDDTKSAVANKILAVVESDSPAEVAQRGKMAAQSVLDELWRKVIDELNSELARPVPDQRVQMGQKQIESFLEFYAAWWPFADDGGYPDARRQVELLLAGRKALRDFAPADGRDGIPKSSLDGGREAVIEAREGAYDLETLSRLGIKRGELLDAVSLIKRLGEKERFVSVSRVAADPFIRRLKAVSPESLERLVQTAQQASASDLVNRFRREDFSQYADFPYDTQLFFGPPRKADEPNSDLLQKARALYDTVDALCKDKKLNLRRPYPYFAVLAADGDHMGAVIGKFQDQSAHIGLSQAMGRFANAARDVVSKRHGVIIYCGGDDVLAFLPLDTAIECACALNAEFAQHVSGFVIGQNPANDAPTLSCGISIAHYGEHLQDLLQWARDAERNAKDAGRDRLAVHLHTRTGGEQRVQSVRGWNEPDGGVLEHWNSLAELFRKDLIPDGAAYELRRLAGEFSFDGADAQVLQGEMRRILERKRRERGTKPIDAHVIEQLTSLAGASAASLAAFVHELIIARHIAAGCEAGEVKS